MSARYDCTQSKDYVSQLLQKYGVKQVHAQIVSGVLVEGDMRGIESHGINGLPHLIIKPITKEIVDVTAEPFICPKYAPMPAMDVIDANGSLGHVASMMAVKRVKELAATYGCARVDVINSHHFGAAGVYSDEIASEYTLSGKAYCTTGSIVISYGGTKPRIGTNPIAWSLPYRHKVVDGEDIAGIVNLDCATSTQAANVIVKALREGYKKLPFKVIDLRTGHATDEPALFGTEESFFENAGLMPAGGLKDSGDGSGYKMGGIGMLIELQTVASAGFSGMIKRGPQDRKKGQIRQTFCAESIGAFRPLEQVLEDIYATIVDIKKCSGGDVLYPGEREEIARRDSVKNGIQFTPAQITMLKDLASKVGLGELRAIGC